MWFRLLRPISYFDIHISRAIILNTGLCILVREDMQSIDYVSWGFRPFQKQFHCHPQTRHGRHRFFLRPTSSSSFLTMLSIRFVACSRSPSPFLSSSDDKLLNSCAFSAFVFFLKRVSRISHSIYYIEFLQHTND